MGRIALSFAISAALALGACGGAPAAPEAGPITPGRLADRIRAGAAPLVLDVRTREEYRQGHIPGAVNIPQDELPDRLAELPIAESDEVVVHCQRGGWARRAEAALREAGYANVRDLRGHWRAWQEAGLPIETGSGPP